MAGSGLAIFPALPAAENLPDRTFTLLATLFLPSWPRFRPHLPGRVKMTAASSAAGAEGTPLKGLRRGTVLRAEPLVAAQVRT